MLPMAAHRVLLKMLAPLIKIRQSCIIRYSRFNHQSILWPSSSSYTNIRRRIPYCFLGIIFPPSSPHPIDRRHSSSASYSLRFPDFFAIKDPCSLSARPLVLCKDQLLLGRPLNLFYFQDHSHFSLSFIPSSSNFRNYKTL